VPIPIGKTPDKALATGQRRSSVMRAAERSLITDLTQEIAHNRIVLQRCRAWCGSIRRNPSGKTEQLWVFSVAIRPNTRKYGWRPDVRHEYNENAMQKGRLDTMTII
jgi:hypothetical protein